MLDEVPFEDWDIEWYSDLLFDFTTIHDDYSFVKSKPKSSRSKNIALLKKRNMEILQDYHFKVFVGRMTDRELDTLANSITKVKSSAFKPLPIDQLEWIISSMQLNGSLALGKKQLYVLINRIFDDIDEIANQPFRKAIEKVVNDSFVDGQLDIDLAIKNYTALTKSVYVLTEKATLIDAYRKYYVNA